MVTLISPVDHSNIYNVQLSGDAQFGFRKGGSTTDAIFVINTVIQKMLKDKKILEKEEI